MRLLYYIALIYGLPMKEVVFITGCSADGYTGLPWKEVFESSNLSTQIRTHGAVVAQLAHNEKVGRSFRSESGWTSKMLGSSIGRISGFHPAKAVSTTAPSTN